METGKFIRRFYILNIFRLLQTVIIIIMSGMLLNIKQFGRSDTYNLTCDEYICRLNCCHFVVRLIENVMYDTESVKQNRQRDRQTDGQKDVSIDS